MAGKIVKIVLENTHPPVWRRVVLPEKINFEDLHEIIQVAFEWEGYHLHDFSFPNEYFRVVSIDDEEWGDYEIETEVLLDDYLEQYNWIRYTYDFGDDWQHKIVFEKKDSSYQQRYATVIKAKGNGFYEDSGGVWENSMKEEFFMDEINAQLEQMLIPKRKEKKKTKNSLKTDDYLKELEKILKEKERLLKELEHLKENEDIKQLQNIPPKPSRMYLAIQRWWEFYENYDAGQESYEQMCFPFAEAEGALKPEETANRRIEKTDDDVSMQKLLEQLDVQETKDYCKYLQISITDEKCSKKKRTEALAAFLKTNPRYVLWAIDEAGFQTLELLQKSKTGPVECELEPNAVAIAMSMGLLRCKCVGKYGNTRVEFTFAKEAEEIFSALPKLVRKREYRMLERMDEQVIPFLMRYGVMDFSELYTQYQMIWGKETGRNDFFRFVYWHMYFHGDIEIFENVLDGQYYAAMPEADIQETMQIRERYAKGLPYRKADKEELQEIHEGINAAYGEWQAYGDYMTCIVGLSDEDVVEWMQQAFVAIFNGAGITEQYEAIMERRKPKKIQEYTELWYILMGVAMETGLAGLKGYSRMEILDMPGKVFDDVMPVTTSENTVGKITAHTHLYQMPSELQMQLYQLVTEISPQSVAQMRALLKQSGGRNEEIKELLSELEENHIFESNIISFPAARSDTYRRSEPKVGRNDPCPCGSGKKYKHCCGKNK